MDAIRANIIQRVFAVAGRAREVIIIMMISIKIRLQYVLIEFALSHVEAVAKLASSSSNPTLHLVAAVYYKRLQKIAPNSIYRMSVLSAIKSVQHRG